MSDKSQTTKPLPVGTRIEGVTKDGIVTFPGLPEGSVVHTQTTRGLVTVATGERRILNAHDWAIHCARQAIAALRRDDMEGAALLFDAASRTIREVECRKSWLKSQPPKS